MNFPESKLNLQFKMSVKGEFPLTKIWAKWANIFNMA